MAHSPAGPAPSLLGVGPTHPLGLQGGDVVGRVKVLHLDLAAVDHVDHIVYRDTTTQDTG